MFDFPIRQLKNNIKIAFLVLFYFFAAKIKQKMNTKQIFLQKNHLFYLNYHFSNFVK